ncbi:hypothetical protein ATCC90586_004160 [Pythium insidiosum]|nr:hypothetical protein ATCC90586_004160 [Pythium insidiosum]
MLLRAMRNGSKTSAMTTTMTTTTTTPPPSSSSAAGRSPAAALTPGDQPPSASNIVSETPTGPSSSTKKQRSIHDFFSHAANKPRKTGVGEKRASPESPPRDEATELHLGRKKRSITTNASLENEPVKKRIDYDCLDGDESSEGTQGHDSMLTPKRIDFGGLCPSSQRSEPDVEPVAMNSVPASRHSVVLADPFSRSLSQSSGYFGGGNGMFSQDDMDFCTPLDQPVVPLSHPTTPSPIKKRQRRNHNPQFIQEEEVQNITQDMTHMDVATAKAARVAASVNDALLSPDATMRDVDTAAMDTSALVTSSTDSTDMLLATPQRVLGLPSAFLPGRRGLRNESRDIDRKMVHMDVKLPNILVAAGEVYKLGDLGTVALADGTMEITEGDNRYLSRGGEDWQKIRDGDLVLFRMDD